MNKAEEKRALSRKTKLIERKKGIIMGVAFDVSSYYFDLAKANSMSKYILTKYNTNGYDSTLNMDEFVFEITKDLRSISHDKHIKVGCFHTKYKPRKYRLIYPSGSAFVRSFRKIKNIFRIIYWRTKNKISTPKYYQDNFTYGSIKILPGNIGYVEFFDFSTKNTPDKNKERIKFKSVLKFLSKTDAVIIDLRNNLGGNGSMVTKVSSYFLDKRYLYTKKWVVRFDSLYKVHTHKNDTILYHKDFTTGKSIKSHKDKPMFVLTSKYTFSAAEALTYSLKNSNRAMVIGDTTGGGGNGHFGGSRGNGYWIVIPCIPIYDEQMNNYSWEGVGIIPNVAVNSKDALNTALDSAKKYQTPKSHLKKEKIYKNRNKDSELFKKLNYVDSLYKYCGTYGPLRIFSDSSKLYFTYDLLPEQILIPKGKNHFISIKFPGINFIRDDKDEIIKVIINWDDKYKETYRKL